MLEDGPDGTSGQHLFPPSTLDHEQQSEQDNAVIFSHDMEESDLTHQRDGVTYPDSISVFDRIRQGMARFGRLSGMWLPGIKYTSINGRTDHSRSSSRPMGGGINHDGVFSNINAKPDRVRESIDPHDRQMCIRDSFGANSIADSDTAWSPDGSFVGDVDEMIIGTMTIGTIFAFVWNMVISGTFQFIGFVLTFLLHTTHAAKLGSRAGLGVSLIQYGLELLRNIDLAMKEALKKKQAASKSHSSDTISLPTQNALSHSKLILSLIHI